MHRKMVCSYMLNLKAMGVNLPETFCLFFASSHAVLKATYHG